MKSTHTKDHPGVIAFPPLIWLTCAVISGLVQHFIIFPSHMMRDEVSLPIGIAMAVAAFSLVIWAGGVLKVAGTNVNPSQPALTIVRNGPYRFTRNPMYLGLCLFQVSLAFFLNDWISLLFVIPLALVLHFGVILREERYLEAKFGDPYLALRREVRRWI